VRGTRCHSAWQPNPGRRSTYRRGKSVQTTGATSESDKWRIEPAIPGTLAAGAAGSLNEDICLLFFAARRREVVDEAPCPIQCLYADNPANVARTRRLWFRPFVLDNGTRIELPPLAEISLDGLVKPESGMCWYAALPELSTLADSMSEPSRSRLIVLENGAPLGPQHSAHDTIRSAGGGRLAHWNSTLYFSTSNNSDPRTNGRSYTALVPG
jgi:hypothetical protein